MSKKLFRVNLSVDFPVVAETPEEAAAIASKKATLDLIENSLRPEDFTVSLAKKGELVGGWESDCETLDGSMTLEDAWELQR